MVSISADRDVCIGAGNCVRTAPEVFDQDDEEGLVVILTDRPPPSAADRIRLAADLCPAAAITVRPSPPI